ncbi:MAG: nucleotide disphospho-sugar-binding domain-containing protein [Bacteroidota bacterium]
MAHILCITSGLTGILNASFEMVSRLEAAGHRVSCASPKAVQEKVEAQGFTFLPLPPMAIALAPPLPQFKGIWGKAQRMWLKYRLAGQRKTAAIEALQMEHFRNLLRSEAPDFLIVDVELHEYIMTAYSMQQPMILLSQWFSLWKRPGLPPLLHDTLPGQGWSGSTLGLQLAWLKIRLNRWWIFQKKKWRSMGTNRRAVLQTYAQQVGFPLDYIRENYWPGPFTYGQLPVISITAKEMEFPHDLRPNLHYVGPMVYAQRKEKKDQKVIQSIEQILKDGIEKERTIIYCSVSTFKTGDVQFLQKVIEAVRAQKQWVLIIGMGGLLQQERFAALPENVYAFSWVPQLKVLAKAHLSINHGGIHTINECIYYKVPMLVYSGKRSDQNGCAARVAYHELGIMGDKDKDDVTAIREKITAVCSQRIYQKNIDQLHERMQLYQKDKKLTKIVEAMIKGSAASRRHRT